MSLSLRLPQGGNGETVPDPLSQYAVSDMDDVSDIQYFGFLSHEGGWYIKKMNNVDKTIRYQAGMLNYPAAWSNRESLGYDYFDAIF